MRILEIVFFGQETRSGLEFQSQWPGGLRMCKGPSKKEAGTPPFVLTICFEHVRRSTFRTDHHPPALAGGSVCLRRLP